MAAGVYIHIPFCISRCSYCDFATDILRDADSVQRYVDALIAEIGDAEFNIDKFADTIYFGGGTPSLLTPEQLASILDAVRTRFVISNDAEVTVEMNPATVTPEKLEQFRRLGVNRASFGVQTFDDNDLKLLARGHNAQDARETFRMLRDAGFANVSFDLIAGLPGQTMANWQRNLDEAIALSPEHISLYLLEVHSGTPLAEQVRSGRRKLIDEELAAEMYEVMLDRLAGSGYEQYEISNFAKPGFESRHNTKYWRLDPVIGFGVSAHSFDGKRRWANTRNTDEYVRTTAHGRPAIDDPGGLSAKQLSGEFVFLNLRLSQGVRTSEYRDRFGKDLLKEFEAEIIDLEAAGLVEIDGEFLRLTVKGMLYSNEVFAVFV